MAEKWLGWSGDKDAGIARFVEVHGAEPDKALMIVEARDGGDPTWAIGPIPDPTRAAMVPRDVVLAQGQLI